MRDHMMGWPAALEILPNEWKSPGYTPPRVPVAFAVTLACADIDKRRTQALGTPRAAPEEKEEKQEEKQEEKPLVPDRWYITSTKACVARDDPHPNGVFMRFWNGAIWSRSMPLEKSMRGGSVEKYARGKAVAPQSSVVWLRYATPAEVGGGE